MARARRIVVQLPDERPAGALVRGIRMPARVVTALILLTFAVLVLAPAVGSYLSQRQHVADLAATVAHQERDLAALRAQRARWSDPAYVRAQAGSRLFFVLPGQTTYRVTGGAAPSPTTSSGTPAATLQQTRTDWAGTLLDSLVEAGTTTSPSSRLTPALPANG